MALVVICGVPCSCKSTAAAALAAQLTQSGSAPVVIDEPSLNLSRAASYSSEHPWPASQMAVRSPCHSHHQVVPGADKEKVARASLKAATERALSRRAFVLLDSINGIKGFRPAPSDTVSPSRVTRRLTRLRSAQVPALVRGSGGRRAVLPGPLRGGAGLLPAGQCAAGQPGAVLASSPAGPALQV